MECLFQKGGENGRVIRGGYLVTNNRNEKRLENKLIPMGLAIQYPIEEYSWKCNETNRRDCPILPEEKFDRLFYSISHVLPTKSIPRKRKTMKNNR